MVSKLLLTTISKNKCVYNLEKFSLRSKGSSATETLDQSIWLPKFAEAGTKSSLYFDDYCSVGEISYNYSEEPFPVIEWKFDEHVPMKEIGHPAPRATYFCILEGE